MRQFHITLTDSAACQHDISRSIFSFRGWRDEGLFHTLPQDVIVEEADIVLTQEVVVIVTSGKITRRRVNLSHLTRHEKPAVHEIGLIDGKQRRIVW